MAAVQRNFLDTQAPNQMPLQNLLTAAESLVTDFGSDVGATLSPLIIEALNHPPLQNDKGGSELEELLDALGWDPQQQTFTTSLDPRTFASNLKAVLLCDLQLVGEGSYSYVYKARNRLDNSTVMLKRLRVDSGEEGLSATAIREMSLLRELTGSPYIVKLLDVFYDRRVYLVMEHLDTDLHEHMQKVPEARCPASIKRYMWQILSGMDYAHAHRVIHRDLKPQNLLLDKKSNCIKIADFGLSRTYLPDDSRGYTLEVVTLLYRSPELLLGSKQYSTAVDVWSIACIFAEMISGVPLFMGDSEIGQLYQIFHLRGTPDETTWPAVSSLPEWQPIFPRWKPQSLKNNVPELCDAGIDLMDKMLQIDPTKRLTCKQALLHPYFDDIRNEMQAI